MTFSHPALPHPRCWLFMRIETADGLVGWGESTLEGHTEAIERAFGDLASWFVDQHANGIEDIWRSTECASTSVGPFKREALPTDASTGALGWTMRCGISRVRSWAFPSGSCWAVKFVVASVSMVGSAVTILVLYARQS